MYEIQTTPEYDRWFAGLRDKAIKVRIGTRIRRLALGNAGDVRFIGDGVLELRLDFGPGYRIYYMRKGRAVFILLAGGDKGSQDRDIRHAVELALLIRREG